MVRGRANRMNTPRIRTTRAISSGALIVALLVGLPVSNAWATHRADAERAIEEAKAAHAKAQAVDAASAETAAMIESAEKLIPSRQYTKALEIATKARIRDSFAHTQATSSDSENDSSAKQVEQAIAAAEQARKKADEVGGEWRDTAALIAQAQGLAKSGQYEDAMALAKQAEHQGELGYEQAIGERGADFPPYVTRKQ